MKRTVQHVVIAGGGVAALEAMLALRHLAGPRVRIELVSPAKDFCYRPLRTREPFEGNRAPRYDLTRIAAARAVRHRADAVRAVDSGNREIFLASGQRLDYDFLLLAIGARAGVAVRGACTLWPDGTQREVSTIIAELERGQARRVVFAIPAGVTWPLPIYELALQAAARMDKLGRRNHELSIATPELSPLQVFGRRASAEVRDLLESRGIQLLAGVQPGAVVRGHLELGGQRRVPVDRVIAAPRLKGPALEGVVHDEEGFIPVDEHARVFETENVYAAGDSTTCPRKQGGVAAQQADAAAQAIAHESGASVVPKPFSPVMRGILLTGAEPRYMRGVAEEGLDDRSMIATHPFWWPPTKIAGRYLAPFLSTMEPIQDRALDQTGN